MIDREKKAEIQRNRHYNLQQLVKIYGATEVANRMGRFDSYITKIARDEPGRNIGRIIATAAEKAFGMAPGDLDKPAPIESRSKDETISRISGVLSVATQHDKEFVLAMSEWIVSRSMPAIPKDTGLTIGKSDIDSQNE